MADGDKADHAGLAVDGIDNPKAANAVLPHAGKFSEERLTTFWIGGQGANC
jgi:hypothetical protein